jgi:NifB/MoaA-like Fe-S oxidoreductase
MKMPTIVAVAPDSPAADAGLMVGDQLMAVSGESIRDVIHYRMLVDSDEVDLQILRGALELEFDIKKPLARRWVWRFPPRFSTRCVRATTTASSVLSTSSHRVCGSRCTSKTTIIGSRFFTAISPR